MEEVAEATGRLSGLSLKRAQDALTWRRTPDTVDIQALDDEFQALMMGQMLE